MAPKSATAPNPVLNTYSPSSPTLTFQPSEQPAPTGSTTRSIPHPEPVSSSTHHIAGILTTIFGLADLPPSCSEVAVLYLLHPRLQTQACMAPFAAHIISSWNAHIRSGKCKSKSSVRKGLIAVSFDQRNHGTREVSAIANEAWRSGNENHAPDMFSCYAGTALDTSLLIDYLSSYIFPEGDVKIVQNLVLGISLGGHAAWHCVMQDSRISSAVVVIGCPDYVRMMSDRARLSKRKSWVESQGRGFLGSTDFGWGLVEACGRIDPAGAVWGVLGRKREGRGEVFEGISEEERGRLIPAMTRWFGNKRILNLSGGADKLVPYKMGEPFLRWMKEANGKGGWFEGSGLVLEDMVFDGVGHECPPEMVPHMISFINDTLDSEQEMTVGKRISRESRI